MSIYFELFESVFSKRVQLFYEHVTGVYHFRAELFHVLEQCIRAFECINFKN